MLLVSHVTRLMKSQVIIAVYDIRLTTIRDQTPLFSLQSFICYSNEIQCNVVFAFHILCIDFVKSTNGNSFSLMFLYPEITVNRKWWRNIVAFLRSVTSSLLPLCTRNQPI